jgi:addiction module RelE/StbE family toxin
MIVRYLREAHDDLEQIAEYIAQDNPEAAIRVVERIRASVELLAGFPALGRQGRLAGTRELVIARLPSIVPYSVRGNEVVVIRVLHQAQAWPRES